ncbi:MAG: hypothetical protein F6K41_04045 [Symploca sp. SIO3E6]|nr:hypothetical protein [Caldora sp. SIO3E6]
MWGRILRRYGEEETSQLLFPSAFCPLPSALFLKSPPTGGAPPPTNERNKPNPLPSCLLPPASCLLPPASCLQTLI